jgi:hypothetical protein
VVAGPVTATVMMTVTMTMAMTMTILHEVAISDLDCERQVAVVVLTLDMSLVHTLYPHRPASGAIG